MKIMDILDDKYTKKGTWIKDGVLMCSKECCGAPVNECSCDSSCKKCNCYNLKENKVIEATSNEMATLRSIVDNRQAEKIHGMMVDMFTASAMVKVYDALNKDNQSKFKDMINKNLKGFMAMQSFAMKQVK